MAKRALAHRAPRENGEHRRPDSRQPAPGRGARAAEDKATAVDLNRLIHERVRLGIVSALAVNDSLTFNELKTVMGTTDGNLSVHARKLEEAGYIDCRKSFEGRVPRTDFRITATGRRALERYLEHMESIIRTTRSGAVGGGGSRA
ncbi:MAG: winged helix-turn-helix domain-containing protein [Gemmatimonadota bacterium]